MAAFKEFLHNSVVVNNTKEEPEYQILEKLLNKAELETADPQLSALEELFFTKVPAKSTKNCKSHAIEGTTGAKWTEAQTKVREHSSSRQTRQRSKPHFSKFAQDSKLFKLLTGPDSSITNELNARRPQFSKKEVKEHLGTQLFKSDTIPKIPSNTSSPTASSSKLLKSDTIISRLLSLPAKSTVKDYLQNYPGREKSCNKSDERISSSSSLLQNLISPNTCVKEKVNSVPLRSIEGSIPRQKSKSVSIELVKKSKIIKKDPQDDEPMESVSTSDTNSTTTSSIVSYLIETAFKPKNTEAENKGQKPIIKVVDPKDHMVLHQCDVCDQVFESWLCLIKHKKLHQQPKKHQCETCKLIFLTAEALADHSKLHMDKDVKPLICHLCKGCFPNENSLKGHQCVSANGTNFRCSSCRQDFSTKEFYEEHQKKFHGSLERPFPCDKCPSRFGSRKALKIHQKAHIRQNLLNCTKCNKRFTRKRDFLLHKKKHKMKANPTKGPRFPCEICGKSFKFEKKFKSHIGEHMSQDLFPCDECEMSFSSHKALQQHKKAHNGEKLNSCPECGKCFSYEGNLTTHLKAHYDAKPHSCEQCGESFAKRSELAVHRETHTEKVLYKCQHCGRICPTHRHLIRHARCHSAVKPFKCNSCDKSFKDQEKLSMHIMTHTGEKPYKCDFCEKRFVHKSSISQHMKVHSAERSFSCGMCGRHFFQELEFVAHIKSHTRQAVSAVTATDGSSDGFTEAFTTEKNIMESGSGSVLMPRIVSITSQAWPVGDVVEDGTGLPGSDTSSSEAMDTGVHEIIRVKEEPVDDYESGGQNTEHSDQVQKWTVHKAKFIAPM